MRRYDPTVQRRPAQSQHGLAERWEEHPDRVRIVQNTDGGQMGSGQRHLLSEVVDRNRRTVERAGRG